MHNLGVKGAHIPVFGFKLDEPDKQAIYGLARADGRLINPGFALAWDTAHGAA